MIIKVRAIRAYMGIGFVDGIVEADETFFRESFKGNHSRSKTFTMPRASRKHGNMATKRGISKEQVCVATATYRIGTPKNQKRLP